MSRESAPRPFRVWALTWFTYAAYYTGRKGFSVSKKTMSTELGLSVPELAVIDTLYLAAYAAGQFVNGFVVDRVGARRLLSVGLFGSAAALAAFGSSSTTFALGAALFVNGIFQATGWPGTTRAMAKWTTPKNRGTVMAYWATCYQAGGMLASIWCGALLVRFGFRATFFGPALLLASLAALLWLFLPDEPQEPPEPLPTPSAGGPTSVGSAPMPSLGVPGPVPVAAAQWAVLRSGLLWSYGASYFFIKLIRYALLLWLPFYFSTTLAYAADTAAYVSTAFELGGVLGVIAIGTLSDRLALFSRAGLSALSLVLLAGAFYAYSRFGGDGVAGNVAWLGLIGALLFGPDSLLSGAAAQDAGGRLAPGTATGFVNGIGSIGGVAQGAVVAQLTSAFGWDAMFPAFMVLAIGAAVALIPALWLRARSRGRTAESTPPR